MKQSRDTLIIMNMSRRKKYGNYFADEPYNLFSFYFQSNLNKISSKFIN